MDILKSFAHPEEVLALLKYKFNRRKTRVDANHSTNLQTCYDYLNRTSRSFAAVIQALDSELRDAVCLFYLVLRALDTVEDDLSIPANEKMILLKKFHTYLLVPDWNYTKSQEKDRVVLENFPVISSEFRSLKKEYRDVISDITDKMGQGMTVYYQRCPGSIEQWNEYCHYVAGLVGIGLSNLFSASGLEDAVVGADTTLSNSMGLFLQKTNIIRDYLEDVVDGRHFWPSEVWKKYATQLKDLALPENRHKALCCLNELIINALGHVPDVLKYLSRLNNQSVFNFCAIPQVMAVATLERCYNNPQVFCGVVKIRRGETVVLISRATNIESVKAIFTHFVSKIESRIPPVDPHLSLSHDCISVALTAARTSEKHSPKAVSIPTYLPILVSIAVALWLYFTSIHFDLA